MTTQELLLERLTKWRSTKTTVQTRIPKHFRDDICALRDGSTERDRELTSYFKLKHSFFRSSLYPDHQSDKLKNISNKNVNNRSLTPAIFQQLDLVKKQMSSSISISAPRETTPEPLPKFSIEIVSGITIKVY